MADILKFAFQSHRVVCSCVKIKIQHHAFLCGTNFHQFQTLPRFNHLMGHEFEERDSARRVGAEHLQNSSFGINAHARRLSRYRVAMENLSKQSRFNKELASTTRTKYESTTVKSPPIEP